ncbi:hypothetical protein ACQCVK_22230 [Rossellomorea vietnamensis]|uniref:hypothetical protein n=1 Tax=Rossellomorea vietnamensis TaxID=218284 RepID=UPI003CE8078F
MRRNKKKFSREVVKVGLELLSKTCINIINRSNCDEGYYKNIKSSFNSAKKLRQSLRGKKKFMERWYTLTERYIASGNQLSLRPVIDRIDEKGHYYLYNMQILTYSENAKKVHAKKTG